MQNNRWIFTIFFFFQGDLPKPSNTKISLNESVPNPVEEMDTDDWDQATVTKEPENEDFIPSPVQSPKKLSFQISPEKTSNAIDEQKDALISSAIKVRSKEKNLENYNLEFLAIFFSMSVFFTIFFQSEKS